MKHDNLICITLTTIRQIELLLLSIKVYSSVKGIDFLILTPTPLDKSLSNVINALELPITIQHIGSIDSVLSVENTVNYKYNKILQLNSNLIVQGDISRIFDLEFKSKVCTIDSDIIKPFLYSSDESIPHSYISDKNIIFCNFTESINIQERMNTYFKNLLEYYKNSVDESKYNSDHILRKQYEWGSGRIIFEKEHILITSWTRTGYHKVLNTHIIEASWSGYTHILIMNNDYTKYVCIRLNDLDIGNGNIDTSLKDTIPKDEPYELPIIKTGTKKLVYFCVFHNKGYMELLKILLLTLKIFSKTDTIDFLVFTSIEFESLVTEISAVLDIPIKTKLFEFNSLHEAACARLFIFDYEHIYDYNKILYLDTDIVIQNDILRIFDIYIGEKLYAVQEYDLNGEGHGAWFFDFTTIDKNTPGINSGVLLFRNTPIISKIFNDIKRHISNLKKTQSLIPLCMDQPFIIYHFFKNNMYNSQLMRKYVFLSELNPPPNTTSYSEITFCHFVWPIGNTWHKKERMIKYTQDLLNNYNAVSNKKEYDITNIIDKQYTWSNGVIEFKEYGLLKTPWVNGSYKILNKGLIEASWAGIDHVLIMNDTNTSFTAFNKSMIELLSKHVIVP